MILSSYQDCQAMITRYGMSEDFDMVAMENVTNSIWEEIPALHVPLKHRRFWTRRLWIW